MKAVLFDANRVFHHWSDGYARPQALVQRLGRPVPSVERIRRIKKECCMRDEIVEAIRRERAHQSRKWGQRPRTVGEWLLILERELQEAKEAWATTPGDRLALGEILQVATVAMACMEEHGVVERPPADP